MNRLSLTKTSARALVAEWWPSLTITALAIILTWIWLGLGVMSPPGLALAGIAILMLLYRQPSWLVVITPALMFVPGRRTVFFHEMALVLLLFLVLLHGLRHRARWLTTLDSVECANLAFVAYGLFTVFWSGDFHFYMHGVRRLMVGVVSFWVAYRMARFVPRRTFELGLLAGTFALSGSALAQSARTTGFGQKYVSRGEATDLGWGKANYIAAMLLVLGPPLLDLAFRARSRTLRTLAWLSSALTLVMQIVIASRAASILYFAGLYTQLTGGRRRGRWLIVLAVALVMFAALMTPSGQMLLSRFTDLRELGGMIVRIWYWREAWLRTKEGFPLGLGLNQGYIHPDKLGSMGTHDYWLDISSELGVPGILLWIVFLVVLWRRLRLIARTPGWEREGFALQIGFWLNQLHTLVEPTFQGLHFQYVFFWVMGGYIGYHAASQREALTGVGQAASDDSRARPSLSPPATLGG